MDGTSFDGFVRSFVIGETRRRFIRRGAFAALGTALIGSAVGEPATAEECRGSGLQCRRDEQCCSGKCRNNGTCAPAKVGAPCDPDNPADCRSGVCGCTKRSVAGELVSCTCRRATCTESGEAGCEATADCCDGFCLASRGVCFPPQQQCVPEGASCRDAPTLCCPGRTCVDGVCVEQL
jgi:hypothetical protein